MNVCRPLLRTRLLHSSWALLCALVATAPAAIAGEPAPDPLVRENATVKISDHVYVIADNNVPMVPNVGIIVGSRATLIVDTGLGARNGATIVREAAKVSRNTDLYLVATHFHAEHLLGIGGFPATTKLIMARAQQADIDEFGYQQRDNFAQRSALAADLLRDAQFRKADVMFERTTDLDLGGVRVRMLWVGPTHTRGDTAIFVEEDRVLFSGDVVMNKAFPAIGSPHASVTAWLSALDTLEALGATTLVPSHGDMGDARMIDQYRQYFRAVQARTDELKRAGRSVDETATVLTSELTARFSDWRAPNRITGAVRTAYAPPPVPAATRP